MDIALESIQIKEASNERLHPLIRKRWSARSFSEKPIEKEELELIFEAASWAPSAMNEQPWNYIFARREDAESFHAMYDLLSPGNQPWAKHAAVLILCYTDLVYAKNGEPNESALHDTGLANENLILQALSLDIYGHMMGGFSKAGAIEKFDLKDTQVPVCMIALGYLADPNQLEEPFKSREISPRNRKELAQFVKDLSE